MGGGGELVCLLAFLLSSYPAALYHSVSHSTSIVSFSYLCCCHFSFLHASHLVQLQYSYSSPVAQDMQEERKTRLFVEYLS